MTRKFTNATRITVGVSETGLLDGEQAIEAIRKALPGTVRMIAAHFISAAEEHGAHVVRYNSSHGPMRQTVIIHVGLHTTKGEMYRVITLPVR